MFDDDGPETPTERVALVVWYMAHGLALSPREIKKITGLSRFAVQDTMCRISRVLPIYQDSNRIWRVCEAQGGPMLKRLETMNQDAAESLAVKIATANQDAAERTQAHIETVNTEARRRMNMTARALARMRGETWL